MKLKSLPKALFAEVIDYIADYERLEGLDQILEGQYTPLEVRSALREFSIHLRKEIESEKAQKSLPDFQKDPRFTPKVKELLSVLSPGDERRILTHFGLLDD